MTRDQLKKTAIVSIACVLIVAAIVITIFAPKELSRTVKPTGIMGTTCEITVFAKARNQNACFNGPEAAADVLRSVEVLMSAKMDASMLSRINAGPGGMSFACGDHFIEVLAAARAGHRDSDGAFDVTIGPLIDLWKQAGRGDVMPSDADILAARAASSWDDFAIDGTTLTKARTTARMDLGGIAKGYAIDNAVEALLRYNPDGGFIDVGGDLKFFGQNPNGPDWSVSIRDPFGDGFLGTVHVDDGAVCTSGDYARYVTIEGQRFSHIIDPRTGMPTRVSPSVTVLAPTAMQADVWATALSVLGPEALAKDDDGNTMLPDGVEAMIVIGDQGESVFHMTDGFAERFVPATSATTPAAETPAE